MKYVWILLVAITFSCSQKPETLPFFNNADFTPQWISSGEAAYSKIHTLPSFAFINQNGDTITTREIDGHIVIADFFFTVCPGICPRLTKNMSAIQSAFPNDPDVLLLSHSVTPDMDSVPVLKAYADSHGIKSPQWHLLTGKRSEIYAIARQGYFADEEIGLKKDDNEFLHTENFILIDQHQRIRGVYNGTNPMETERLIEDIKELKKSVNHENS